MKRALITMVFLLSLSAFGDEARIPLEVQFPKPLFVGTPRPLDVSNLESVEDGKSPKTILVPGDVSIVSTGKKVTSSDPYPVIGELAFVNDGDKSGVDGAIVELEPGPQWVQLDLGESFEIAAVAVWHYHSQARVYHDFVVQVADDPNFRSGVQTIFNNDIDDTLSLGRGKDRAYVETYRGRVIDAKDMKARYVRLYSNGNTSDELNHYCEVEVYGRPVK